MTDDTTDLLVLGAGVAGFAAIKKAREMNFKLDITVIDPWAYDSYSPCGLPFLLDGTVERMDSIYHRLPFSDMNINRIVGTALSIETGTKLVRYRTDPGEEEEIGYKKLIIATGGKPWTPDIENVDGLIDKGVYHFNNPLDATKVLKALEEAKKAVVAGAGPKGCEIALGLANRDIEVLLCEALGNVLPTMLDTDMAREVRSHLEMKGLQVRTDSSIKKALGSDSIESIHLGDEEVPCDMMILATGVRPDVELFRAAGIEADEKGIVVGEDMCTNQVDVYACGDCVSSFSVIDKKPVVTRLATTALRQGMVAGSNAAGENLKYPGTASPVAVVLDDLEIASVGFTAGTAKERGYDIKQVKNRGKDRPEFFPGWSEITLKLVFNKEDRRLLGAQAVGGGGVIARIDHLGVAISMGVTVDDLYLMELSYTPPRSEGTDIIVKASGYAHKKLK